MEAEKSGMHLALVVDVVKIHTVEEFFAFTPFSLKKPCKAPAVDGSKNTRRRRVLCLYPFFGSRTLGKCLLYFSLLLHLHVLYLSFPIGSVFMPGDRYQHPQIDIFEQPKEVNL